MSGVYSEKMLQCAFGRAVFLQEPHIKMAIVGGPFRLAVPGGGGPCFGQVVQAVPVDSRNLAVQQFSGALEAELLHLLGAKRPTSEIQMGRSVTARISSIFLGHSLICQWFQSRSKSAPPPLVFIPELVQSVDATHTEHQCGNLESSCVIENVLVRRAFRTALRAVKNDAPIFRKAVRAEERILGLVPHPAGADLHIRKIAVDLVRGSEHEGWRRIHCGGAT